MKKFIAIFREPNGRTIKHSENEIKKHQENWKNWFLEWEQQGKIIGGGGLTLNGRMIKGNGELVTDGIYRNGSEIVGGYLLINATDFEGAIEMMKTCPIYEFGGYTEIRELQNSD
jgi:hypothetical protein